MIFDNTEITAIVQEWQNSKRKVLLTEIIEKSDPLIEVIVSRFNNTYREDLIQECRLRLISKLGDFDVDKGKLHAWLTTILSNHCINYVTLSSRMLNIDDLGIEVTNEIVVDSKFDYDIGKLITRNRDRFPSLPVTMIDDVTRYVCLSTVYTVYGKSRGVIRNIVTTFNISRVVATVIYNSTILYMRQLHIIDCDVTKLVPIDDLTLLRDFENIIGKDKYEEIAILFSGMYLKFP